MKTVKEVRDAFWDAHPKYATERKSRKRQNDYRADIRFMFIDYVEHLRDTGTISEKLADRVTL